VNPHYGGNFWRERAAYWYYMAVTFLLLALFFGTALLYVVYELWW
jgi:hypothetical protein